MTNRWGASASLAVALGVGVAAWSASGVLTLTSGMPGASRVGLLPGWTVLAGFVMVTFALLLGTARSTAHAATVGAMTLAIVPWLPLPWPTAVLAWAGPWSWVLAALAISAYLVSGRVSGEAAWWRPWVEAPRAPWLAGAVALLVYAGVGARVAPVVPGGDEPHYLIITQSLLSDGDLRIENNHQRGDYLAYASGRLRPDFLRRGLDRQIYSIHLPGVSALVLPAFALGGHPLVKLWLALIAACGALAAWRVGFAVSGRASAAWFAWAATALTAPFLFLAFTVYPDGPGGVLVVCAVAGLVSLARRPARSAWWWLCAGLAPAALPWLHPRFSVIAGALGVVFAARAWNQRPRTRALAALLAVPVVSALAWFGYYVIIYGSPSPSVAYGHYTQMALSNAGRGLMGLGFDQQFGLVATAPVYGLVLIGAVLLARRDRRLALEWTAIVLPYVAVSAMYHMWWGGHSSPARFLGPVMLACAAPLAVVWQAGRLTTTKVLQLGLLAVSLVLAAALAWVDEGRLVFNTRDGFALWAVWASRSVDLARALPSVFRTTPSVALASAAIWIGCLVMVWVVVRWIETRDWVSRERAALALTVGLAVGASVAMTAAWRMEGVSGIAPTNGQLELLRRGSEREGAVGLTYHPFRAVTWSTLARGITLDGWGSPGRPGWAWLWVPRLAAGSYRVWFDNRVAGASFDVDVVVGRGESAVDTWRLRDLPIGRTARDVDLPWSVRSIALRGPGDARASLRSVSIEALAVEPGAVPGGPRVTEARRYGATVVMAVGEEVYLEPSGAWTAGGSSARLIVIRDSGQAAPRMTLRAGPVATNVELESGAWRQQMSLVPGEQREIGVPVTPGRSAAIRVTTSAGFRPSQTDAASTDTRFLGVWLEFR